MTNSYLVPAFGILAVGAACFAISWMIAVPLIACSIGLFTAVTGVQIYPDSQSYRNYFAVFGFKIGSWSSLTNINEVTLILSTERKTLKGMVPGAMPVGRSSTIQVRTYDLLLNDGITSFELNDFLTYKNARATYDVLTDTLKIAGRDCVAEKIASNRAKKSH